MVVITGYESGGGEWGGAKLLLDRAWSSGVPWNGWGAIDLKNVLYISES